MVFIKTIDMESGTLVYGKCGWLGNDLEITMTSKNALILKEGTTGHGTVEEWLEFLGDGHPEWILSHRYTDEKPFVPEFKQRGKSRRKRGTK